MNHIPSPQQSSTHSNKRLLLIVAGIAGTCFLITCICVAGLGIYFVTSAGTGSCTNTVAGNSRFETAECKAGWLESECQDWDDMRANGDRWHFSKNSCQELGYTQTCGDENTYTQPGQCPL